ncbi:MAG: peptidoglycan DD-metalloendopeptidase family protein [Deltaproteobacteria bacterium]|nr:peptidoglycan DD-metalloendopeptidase family protein [Deltaproteobacteria bacterium]
MKPVSSDGLSPLITESPEHRDSEIRKAARSFEGLLVGELMRTMRRTVGGSAGFEESTFQEMMDRSLVDASAGALGLEDMLAEQLGASPRRTRSAELTGLPAPMISQVRTAQTANSRNDELASPLGDLRAGFHEHLSPGQRFGAPRPRGSEGCGLGHCGVDLARPVGTPVASIRSGVVVAIGRNEGSRGGLFVRVRHDDDLDSAYFHLSSIRSDLMLGQNVEAGENIGAVGSTGTSSTGPHLHFELRAKGRPIDPTDQLEAWVRKGKIEAQVPTQSVDGEVEP